MHAPKRPIPVRPLILLYVGGSLGLLAELLLLGHLEGWTQWIPLVLLVAATIAGLDWLRDARPNARRRLHVSGWLLALSGLIGTVLHVRGNWEFELEMYPDMRALELFAESMTGATPALAPGALLILGLMAAIVTKPVSTADST